MGSDCSGMCSEVLSLELCLPPGIGIEHVFASDTSKPVREFIRSFFNPNIVYEDITQRNVEGVQPVDVYHAGFPCQPFSRAGKKSGILDPRGTVVLSIAEYIVRHLPPIFVLENSSAFVMDFHEECAYLVDMLEKIADPEDAQLKAYNVELEVFNALDFGMPQRRSRVYIVGILKKASSRTFVWPRPPSCQRSLTSILDLPQDANEVVAEPSERMSKEMLKIIDKFEQRNMSADLVNEEYIHNLGPSKPTSSLNICPCLTSRRCARLEYYSSTRQRRLSITDFLRLNGVPARRFANWTDTTSRSCMGGMCGNAEALCLLVPILSQALRAIGVEPRPVDFATLDLH